MAILLHLIYIVSIQFEKGEFLDMKEVKSTS